MPYEVSFQKSVHINDPQSYINECCIGGDIVGAECLLDLRTTYGDLECDQEDWGWYIWFTKDAIRLAVDIVCDDPQQGLFRIHVTSRVKRWVISDRIQDTPELEELRDIVVSSLRRWGAENILIQRLNEQYV